MTDTLTPEEITPIDGQYSLDGFQDELEQQYEEKKRQLADLEQQYEENERRLADLEKRLFGEIPDQERLRQAAAIITGKPAESYTAEQATEIMWRYYAGKHPFGDVEENLDLVHDLALARTKELWGKVPQDELERLKAGAIDVGTAAAEAGTETARQTLRLLASYINSPEYKEIRESITAFTKWYEQVFEEVAEADQLPENVRRLFPFLKTEYEEMRHDPAFSEYTLHAVVEGGFDREGNIREGTPFRETIERAMRQQAEFEAAAATVAEIELVAAEMPKLQSLIPTQHTMPNNTLMNHLAGAKGKQPINAGAHDLPVIPATKKRGEITAYVMAVYEADKGITSNLTEHERDVSDAIMSLWEQAKREGKPAAFTADGIYRAMPGRGERPGPQQKGAITKAVEKFLHLYLDVDATDELRKRGKIGDGDTYHVKDYYLRAQEHIYKAKGGQTVKAWVMTGEPLILSYARLTGQLLTVPAKYLAIEKVKQGAPSGELLTMNAGRQAMTSYMLRRIAVIKHDIETAREAWRSNERRRTRDKTLKEKPLAAFRKQSDTILFSSVFSAAGTETDNRKQQMNNRKFCLDVLDFWKASGYIKGYRQQKKGRSITGVEIEI